MKTPSTNKKFLLQRIWKAIQKFMCWEIWLARNKAIFQNISLYPQQVVSSSCSLFSEVVIVNGLKSYNTGLINDKEHNWLILEAPFPNSPIHQLLPLHWKLQLTRKDMQSWIQLQRKYLLFF